MTTRRAAVLDVEGQRLSSTSEGRARRLIEEGKASLVLEDPLTIRLGYGVTRREPSGRSTESARSTPETPVGQGKRILLHICCAPCGTYTVQRLREQAYEVTGYWYNPNVHPFSEHERRRGTLAQYAPQVELPVIWEPGYGLVEFLRSVQQHERLGERCGTCYQIRLDRAALVASREGFDAFTTTLLISPYQDQVVIRKLGEQAAAQHGVQFHFENMRRGWAEHSAIARASGLYSQRYCGCVYSEWESLDPTAPTSGRRRT